MQRTSASRLWSPDTPFSPRKFPFFYGWLIGAGGALGMIASIPGQTIGVNVFNEQLILELDASRTQISFAYLIGTALSGFLLPWCGRLYDRIGARKLAVLSGLCLGLSLLFLSEVDRIVAVLMSAFGLQGALVWGQLVALVLGFLLIRFWGQGTMTMTSRNMVGKWWQRHRGKVLSLSGLGVGVSFSLAPLFFDFLIQSYGWRGAWKLLALASAGGFGLFAWLIYRDNPEECGLEVDGGNEEEGEEADPEFRTARHFTRREALRTYSFWLFTGAFAIQACYMTGYSFHVIDVGAEVGMSKRTALNLFFPAAVVGGICGLLSGWAGDRWRLKYVVAMMSFGLCLPALGLIWGDPFWMPALIVAGFGISGGCFGTLSGAFIPRFFGIKHLGAISGFFMSMMVFASSAGPYLYSVSRDLLGSYDGAHWATLVLALLWTAGSAWADNPQRKLHGA